MLNKFPVIKNGVEYEVKIMDNDWFEYIWDVRLYQKKKYKLFGIINMTKRILLYDVKSFGLKEHEYKFTDVEYLDSIDFIYMANATIDEYEKQLEKNKKYSNELTETKNRFNNWDGICK